MSETKGFQLQEKIALLSLVQLPRWHVEARETGLLTDQTLLWCSHAYEVGPC